MALARSARRETQFLAPILHIKKSIGVLPVRRGLDFKGCVEMINPYWAHLHETLRQRRVGGHKLRR